MFQDVRYAFRTLGGSPGFTAAAIVTLALGIGANTAIFTAVYGVLLKPLPYHDPDRLVRISETRRGGGWNVAVPNYLDWRARNHVFSGMAIFNTANRVILSRPDAPASVLPAGTCEVGMFPLMGIAAAHGRVFVESEAEPVALVAVLTDDAWWQHFGGDPGIVGQPVRLDGDPVTIVGILPPGVRPFEADVWFPHRPKQLSAMQLDRANHPGFGVVARLRAGTSAEQAQREMTAIAESLAREYPASNTDMGIRVMPMLESVAGTIRPTLRLLMGAVAVLLLIACAEGSSPRNARLRSALVTIEVALLIVLLTAAALMQRTLSRLAAVDLGFEADKVISVPLRQVRTSDSGDRSLVTFADALLDSARAQNGASLAALAWPFDYTGFTWATSMNFPERPQPPGREPMAQTAAVTPGYFATMGIPLLRGRDFGAEERPGAAVSAIVNQTFATRFFPGEDPIGRRVNAMRIPEMQNMTIVGVVGDTRRGGTLRGYTPEIYIPFAQFPQGNATLIVRGAGADPLALANDIKLRVAAIDPATAVGTIRKLSDAMARTYGDRRALSWLLAIFAALALGLTILGIASVVSFTVAQRIPEIGVRIALGANQRDVVRLIVTNALYPVGAGIAAGLIALVPLSRAYQTYLFGISPADPASLAFAIALLVIAALAAAYVPARRASGVDPLTALRGL